MGDDLRHELEALAAEYGLFALYAFGSRAEEIAGAVAGSPVPTSHGASDVDIGVQPQRDRRLTAEDRVHLVQRLESLLDVDRVDLLVLPEASAFLAADVVRGELLMATDLDAEAELQLYHLRRAADLAPLLREQWNETVGAGS